MRGCLCVLNWKAVVAYFKMPSRHSHGRSKESKTTFPHDSCLCQDLTRNLQIQVEDTSILKFVNKIQIHTASQHYNQLIQWNRVLLEKLTATLLVTNSPHFTESKHSLPHSQELTLDYILSQLDPVHALKPYFFKIHFNIILLSMLKFPKWFLSLRFSD